VVAGSIALFARSATGVRAEWRDCAPIERQCIYFANHASHGDFLLLWSVLSPSTRRMTRPVAAADYWQQGRLRRYLAERIFKAVLIERRATGDRADPIATMKRELEAGLSLILFPEGTRNTTEAALLPFKSGLYHLAQSHAGIECVPVWIDNLNRVLPKGEFLPLPLLCTVAFGAPISVHADESKTSFLDRARRALLSLAPANRLANDERP
jgi:1-acyl-sn-glycerol-3-phosphate acyltransferase